jgi:hypothetical protein
METSRRTTKYSTLLRDGQIILRINDRGFVKGKTERRVKKPMARAGAGNPNDQDRLWKIPMTKAPNPN